ncbi:MAG TPA: chemotaxis protein CheB, partial [Thermodesulfobacteriota bacterium]|nr:chemotaxis protein CheB [Thermodesulfobacteriota bacterium]
MALLPKEITSKGSFRKTTSSEKKLTPRKRGTPAKSAPAVKLKPRTPTETPNLQKTEDKSFPIVGMGASAGGLEAFEQFFKQMPSESGLAFVLIPHLDPGHSSMMVDLMKRVTRMQVLEARDDMRVEPDHVYVIPPNKDMAMSNAKLQLTQPERTRGVRMPIDFFLRSLAEDQGDNAIGIILSGTGSDGSLGLRAIHGAGGMIMVQDADNAKYEGMPQSALATGLADYVLPTGKMPEQLLAYVKKTYFKKERPISISAKAPTSLQKIMTILRTQTGHDFSSYKKSTIYRRVEKRMDVHNVEDLPHYIRYLQENSEEVQMLFKELLIGVTSFFRDHDAFEILKKKVLPQLLEGKPEDYQVRVWVPGCASGEEVYSLAIVFREYMDEAKREFKVQIFGTDIDEEAIRLARIGAYPDNIAIDVTPVRLKRFFLKDEGGYRIKKDIRETVVFAVQNVIKDAPFTKLDLLSCRNLLIYLEPELQNRLIPLFHYSLRPGGVLFLGSSETIGKFSDLFKLVDKKWKFFTSRGVSPAQVGTLAGLPWAYERGQEAEAEVRKTRKISVAEVTQKILLEAFVPPSVIVNDKGEITYIHGQTGNYLEPSQGQPSLNILDMAREGLQFELRSALHNAVSKKKEMHKTLRVRTNHEHRQVNLTVKPLAGREAEGLFLVVFEDAKPEPRVKKEEQAVKEMPSKRGEKRQAELAEELAFTKESLQATIEELQAANEELRSTNEEYQSTNEELQSTNEELETSKEELQSVNEELVTVNSELESKIDQLSRTENDMKALLDSINISTIFLDTELRIKRFTSQAMKVFSLISSDIGRPLGDIRSGLNYDNLLADSQKVLDTLQTVEMEVETKDQRCLLTRIMPSRTPENVIDGVVITFTDVSQMKSAEAEMMQSKQRLLEILESIADGFFTLDGEWKFTFVNPVAEKLWEKSQEEMIGRSFWEIAPQAKEAPFSRHLKKAMEEKVSVTFEDGSLAGDIPLEIRAYPSKDGLSVYFH